MNVILPKGVIGKHKSAGHRGRHGTKDRKEALC